MNGYTQLTRNKRYQMKGMLDAGAVHKDIAAVLGVNKSTVSREIKRNAGSRGWFPSVAHGKAMDRRARQHTERVRITEADWGLVEGLLRQRYSPEQVSGRMHLESVLEISPEWVYLHVYADKRDGGDLWTYLRCQKQRRKRYASGVDRRGKIKNRVGIEERPAIVDSRERIGDWEGDTVVGISNRGAIVTMVDRKSRYTLAKKVPGKHAKGVTKAIKKIMAPFKHQCHTVTFDNGTEFSGHEKVAKALETKVYFAHPYHSWERGLNENTNGLLRQYFPKGTDFTSFSDRDVQRSVEQINHRPRKRLEYRSPYEVIKNVGMEYIAKSDHAHHLEVSHQSTLSRRSV